MRTLVVVAVAGCAVGVASSASGVLGSRDLTPAASPAHVVIAAAGRAGVFTVRDGALTRLDRQSPPGRLLIPRPTSGPVATAIAVGAHRAWVARGSRISGYSTDPASPDPVWTATVPHMSGAVMLASSGAWLWVADSGTRDIVPIDVREHRVRRGVRRTTAPQFGASIDLPGDLLGMAAVPDGLWLVSRTPTGGAQVSVIAVRHRGSGPQIVATTVREPISAIANGWSVVVLVRGQVIRIDARSRRIVQRVAVPADTGAISATSRDVVVSDPDTGKITDIPWRHPSARIVVRVGRPARALVATASGFWVAIGPDATPTEYELP
jgi:hypothetical protein